MANLVVDIGNTQTKLAVFKGEELLWFEHTPKHRTQHLNELIKKYDVKKSIVSTVQNDPHNCFEDLNVIPVYFSNKMVQFVNNHYKTPQTLGTDRIAAVAGAVAVNPDKDTLVIDAGTCITYDFVDANKNYYGGSISPGLQMRYKAVNHYTAALPLLQADAQFGKEFGVDTPTAITSGIQNGIKYEIEGFIKQYLNRHPGLDIILTGGDGIFLDTLLKNSIFAPYIKNDPYLVLKGLNAVIQDHND